MCIRNRFAGFLTVLVLFTVAGRAAAQGTWSVEKTFHIGGEGGMDYITLDAENHRLYVPRSTHTMVIDADSGKTLADIPGQKHNHGVALAPEAGRGFISDGEGSVVIFLISRPMLSWARSRRNPMPTELFTIRPAAWCWSFLATTECC